MGAVPPMRARGASGVWELFVPDLSPGTLYKFEVKGQDGGIQASTDPFAKRVELRPPTAAIVHEIDDSLWTDQTRIEQRTRLPRS